jgi:hypothetical protein
MFDSTDRMFDHTAPDAPVTDPPPDVALLLRAHAERRWLSREVIPVLRQIETCEGLPDEQIPAAVAYLEVIWAEALARARETDVELRRLAARGGTPHGCGEQPLIARAHRYHAVVRSLREAVARRVARLLAAPPDGRAGLMHGLTRPGTSAASTA